MNAFATNSPIDETTGQRMIRASRSPRWISVLLLTLFAAQSLWFIATQSLTYDEPTHIIAGVEAWQQGRFEHWNDHPPLGRLWLTLPIARAQADFQWQQLPTGYLVTAMRPGPEWLAWRTRPMNLLLGLLLGAALWFATRRLFSEGSANVALALFAFTPSLIAHFSVATTDGIGTLFIFLAAFQLIRWRSAPTRPQAALLGVALGGLLLAKFYAPPLVLLALGLVLVLAPGRGWRNLRSLNWQAVATAVVIALLTLWGGYFFHVAKLKIGDGQVIANFPNRVEKTWATKSHARLSAYIPAGEFLEGLREVALSNRRGRPSWFLGQTYPKGGIRAYYPVAIALKWPPMLLLLVALSLVLGVGKTCRTPGDLLVMCLFPLVFLVFALNSKYDIGERHILPLYPFALMLAGAIWEHVPRSSAATRADNAPLRMMRLGAMSVVLVLCLNAADALRCAPDYLTYFSPLVASEKRWQLLTDSNLDWGQGLIAVRTYEQQHPGTPIHLAYFGSVDPALYGVKAAPLNPGERTTGTLIVGASCLSGQVLADSNAYRWLWEQRPSRVLDGSLWIYDMQ